MVELGVCRPVSDDPARLEATIRDEAQPTARGLKYRRLDLGDRVLGAALQEVGTGVRGYVVVSWRHVDLGSTSSVHLRIDGLPATETSEMVRAVTTLRRVPVSCDSGDPFCRRCSAGDVEVRDLQAFVGAHLPSLRGGPFVRVGPDAFRPSFEPWCNRTPRGATRVAADTRRPACRRYRTGRHGDRGATYEVCPDTVKLEEVSAQQQSLERLTSRSWTLPWGVVDARIGERADGTFAWALRVVPHGRAAYLGSLAVSGEAASDREMRGALRDALGLPLDPQPCRDFTSPDCDHCREVLAHRALLEGPGLVRALLEADRK